VTAGRATGGRVADGGPAWAQEAVDAAGGLDLLLTDAALGGPVTFVLSTSGHIAAMVNPPGQLGRKGYPVRGAAPGTYVHDR
jgi:hypothetical protein